MIGINEFRYGGFDRDIANTFEAKAQELYGDNYVPPVVGGLIPITLGGIWDSMHVGHDAVPVIAPTSLSQMAGPWKTSLYINPAIDRLTPWTEIEEASSVPVGVDNCSSYTGISQSVNSCVIQGYSRLYVKWGGTWKHVFTSGKGHYGQGNPFSPTVRNPGGVCSYDSWYGGLYGDLRGVQVGYTEDGWDKFAPSQRLSNGQVIEAKGFYQHPYNNQVGDAFFPSRVGISNSAIQGVVHINYYKLGLIDENGVDDRHLAKFIVHTGCDQKNATRNYYDLGISRYGYITNDWVPHTLYSLPENSGDKEQFISSNQQLMDVIVQEI